MIWDNQNKMKESIILRDYEFDWVSTFHHLTKQHPIQFFELHWMIFWIWYVPCYISVSEKKKKECYKLPWHPKFEVYNCVECSGQLKSSWHFLIHLIIVPWQRFTHSNGCTDLKGRLDFIILMGNWFTVEKWS